MNAKSKAVVTYIIKDNKQTPSDNRAFHSIDHMQGKH